ncbi:MAG: TolC family protein [Candidatus Pacebacteria bacterium]|nr:TolC family protein [Candidatus Paceibacterota bacterium]
MKKHNLNSACFACILCLLVTRCFAPPGADLARAEVTSGGTAAAAEAEPSGMEATTSASRQDSADSGSLNIAIDQAVILALGNNRGLDIERLNPNIAGNAEDLERAVFDPVLSASVEVGREKSESRSGDTVHGNTIRSDAGASLFLPTGTLVEAGVETGRTWGGDLSDQYAARAGLTVTQALLRGVGLGVNLADLRQAGLDTRFSKYELYGFAEALVADVETTYWDYVLARRQVDIYRESLALAEKQLTETNVRIRVGDLAETERAAAQAEMALRREGLINVRSRVATLQVRLLRLIAPARLARRGHEVVPLTAPVVSARADTDALEDHIALALKMRPDVKQARLLMQRGDLEIVKTKNGLLPRMDLFVSLGRTGYAGSFGESVSDVADDGYDVAAGLMLEFPLGNRAARARHDTALLSRRQAEESLRNIEDLVREDVEAAYIEVQRAREQIDATAATRRFQEEKLRAETVKFNADKSTALLVATAQRDLLASRVAEVEAVTTYLKALSSFYYLDGSLLKRRGIRTFQEGAH